LPVENPTVAHIDAAVAAIGIWLADAAGEPLQDARTAGWSAAAAATFFAVAGRAARGVIVHHGTRDGEIGFCIGGGGTISDRAIRNRAAALHGGERTFWIGVGHGGG